MAGRGPFRWSWVLLACVSLAACHPSRTQGPDGDVDKPAGGASVEVKDEPRRVAGVGHTANIDRLTVAPDGKSAMTRDTVGGIRLWPRLDGEAEPLPVPGFGADSFSLAKLDDSGWRVVIVDASGGAKILDVRPSGKVEERAELPPFRSALQLGRVLPGGGYILALYRDHTIRLLTGAGKEVALLDERRFKPRDLRLSADGKVAMAVIDEARKAGSFKVEVQALQVSVDPPKITRKGSPRLLDSSVEFGQHNLALSPDGRAVAYTPKTSAGRWDVAVAQLGSDEAPRQFSATAPSHIAPALGFVGRRRLMFNPNDGTLGTLFDLETGKDHPRIGSPQDFVHQGRVQESAGGRMVAAYGTWLFVHDVADRKHRFLGYRVLQAQSVAVSPSGRFVAWGHLQGPVYIEPTEAKDERGLVRLTNVDPTVGASRVRFVDEDHLVVIDAAGGIRIWHWPSKTLVDRGGVSGQIRTVHVDHVRNLLLVDRHNNDARVYEIGKDRKLWGPHIIADRAYRLGLLASDSEKGSVVWTLDSANKLRNYTLAELRSDLTREEIERKGRVLKTGQPAPLAIDRSGRHYGVRWSGTRMEVFVDRGTHIKSKPLSTADVNQVLPAPDGKRFVAVATRNNNVSLTAYDSETLEPLWTFSTGTFNNEVHWSPDSRFVGVAANTGAVLLDANDGAPRRRRCGIEFEAAGAPPPTAFNGVNQRSLCDL